MASWTTCELGDVVNLKRGYDLPHNARSPGPYPVVSSSGITDHHAEAKARGPGVVTGRYGTLGQVFFVPSDYWPLNTSLYVQDFKGNDARFVSYLLTTLSLASQNAAGAVPGVNRNHLHKMEVCIPPPSVQKRIAGILLAYDDLIENCQRRIKILESMARTLYREWFVHFRFPGHEGHRRVASPLGEIPEGWQVRSLGDIAENFDRLRRPLSKMKRADMQGEFPYYGAAKVFDYVNDYIFDGEYLLMAEDGSVTTPDRRPVLQLVNGKFWPNNHTHVLRGRAECSTHFLYLAMSEVDISPYITGAAQPKITQQNMNRIPVACAPPDIHRRFDGLVDRALRQTQVLQRRVENLRRARDLLLPRLLSGRIDVGAA